MFLFTFAFEKVPTGVISYDPTSRIISTNANLNNDRVYTFELEIFVGNKPANVGRIVNTIM